MATALGTGAGVIFAAIAACAIWKQFGAMVHANVASNEAFKIDQRAWASVKEIKLSQPVTVGKPVHVSLTLTNTGKTPALNSVLAEVRMGPSESDWNRDFVIHGSAREVIAPNNTDTFFATATYDDESIKAILGDTVHIYFSGRFEYQDAFGATHHTSFCAYYPAPLEPPTATGYFFNCETGSSMD